MSAKKIPVQLRYPFMYNITFKAVANNSLEHLENTKIDRHTSKSDKNIQRMNVKKRYEMDETNPFHWTNMPHNDLYGILKESWCKIDSFF